jgi:CRP-like cAMP-binding protein
VLKNRVQGDTRQTVLVFADCGEHVLRYLGNGSGTVSASPGEMIAREGDPSTPLCIIITEGIADVVIGDRTITTLRRGDFFIEKSLMADRCLKANLIARSRVQLFELGPGGLAGLLPLFPAVSRHMLHDLAFGLRRLENVQAIDRVPVAVE